VKKESTQLVIGPTMYKAGPVRDRTTNYQMNKKDLAGGDIGFVCMGSNRVVQENDKRLTRNVEFRQRTSSLEFAHPMHTM